MNHIPTPETDTAWMAYQMDSTCHEGDPWGLAARLERRLTIAREALETISRMPIARLYPDGPCIERSDMDEVLKALELTKSKL